MWAIRFLIPILFMRSAYGLWFDKLTTNGKTPSVRPELVEGFSYDVSKQNWYNSKPEGDADQSMLFTGSNSIRAWIG